MGGFGEVWKCLAPGGLHKAIKFVHEQTGDETSTEPTSLEQEYEAFQRIRGIRHPFLMTLERVELSGAELVMVMELADQSLGNRYDECRAEGLPGIPRSELLSYMVDAAEALDVLGRQHGLQHLDVKPANLFLVGGHVKVGDYGLVARHRTSLNGDEPKLGRGLTPKYVAPEILCDRVDARSDQYPLALVYQELLTGVFPYSGRSARQLLLQHSSAEPDVSPLPERDRDAVRRALAKNPAERFPTCLAFVKSLLRGTQVLTAPIRSIPTQPQGPPQLAHKQSGLITPGLRQIGSSSAEATLRLSPGHSAMVETQAVSLNELDFNTQHPGWKFSGEGRPTSRGRVVRASDPAGELHSLHLFKFPSADLADIEPVLAGLIEPKAAGLQTILRPSPRAVSFAVPEKHPSLKDWLAKRKTAGEPALGAGKVRALLAPVAGSLDSLHSQHGYPHGLLSPSTLLHTGEALAVTLFGMGELLRRTRDDRDWIGGNPYAAPEAVAGRPTGTGDQYSLALIFSELRGAWAPPERKGGIRIDWAQLLARESAALKKALAPDPGQRFANCAAFSDALEPKGAEGIALEEVRVVECVERLKGRPATAITPRRPERLTDAILLASGADAVAAWPTSKVELLITRLPDGRLTGRFPVKLTVELALLKLAAFKDQHKLDMMQWTADTFVLKPRSGAHGAAVRGVELVIQLPRNDQAGAGEVAVTARATGGEKGNGDEALIGLIEQFRRAVQNTNERRKAARFPTDLPLTLFPVDGELAVQAPLIGKCLNVSATGFACLIPATLKTEHVFATFPTLPEFAPWALLAKVVRTQPGVRGATIVAARFVHAGG